MLTLSGYLVASAASSSKALARLARGLRPCVMLLYLRMAGVDGSKCGNACGLTGGCGVPLEADVRRESNGPDLLDTLKSRAV